MTMIDINLNGVWRVCRAAMPHMINAGRGGSMTLTNSTSSYIGLPNLNRYSAANVKDHRNSPHAITVISHPWSGW